MKFPNLDERLRLLIDCPPAVNESMDEWIDRAWHKYDAAKVQKMKDKRRGTQIWHWWMM